MAVKKNQLDKMIVKWNMKTETHLPAIWLNQWGTFTGYDSDKQTGKNIE